MPTPLRRTLRRARRGAWYVAAVVLVLMALGAGITSQLLPLAERNPDRIANWLSARAGRPVAFDTVRTQWTRRGPLLRLEGLRIGEGKTAVPVGAAEILVSQYAGLLPGRSFTELRLRNVDLTLQREDDGRWHVRGLPGQQQAGGDPLGALDSLGELQVVGGKLGIDAPSLGIHATLQKVGVRLKVDGDRVRASMRAWMTPKAPPVDAILDFDRARGDGRLYASAKRADLQAWSPLLRVAGVVAERGQGRAEAWTTLRGHRVTTVTVDAALTQVALRGAPIGDGGAGAAVVPRARFGKIEVRARWRDGRDGWRFDAPHLRSADDDGRRTQTLDGLVVAGGKRFGLLAERIDAAPLFAVAALGDGVDPGVRRWLHAARPGGVLNKVSVAGLRGGAVRASARVDDLHFATQGNAPGLSGFSGSLRGDGEGFEFTFDPRATLRFDWPRGFGVVHAVRLRGRVAGWREGAGWRAATSALRVDGEGYGADLRGGMWFQGDGTRPWIDLAAELDDAQVPVAKKFWLRHSMSPATVRWLDTALIGGTVRDGRAVVSGDLDDWPFRDANGLFQADAQLVDAVVKFQPDWPAAERLTGPVSFVADGFTVSGKAMLAGVAIPELRAGIPRFGQAALGIDAKAGGDAAALLALLKQSPLHKQHGDTLDRLRASGPVQATFALDLPLHGPRAAPKIDGSVDLLGTRLAETEWKLAFADVRGKATYDQEGFSGNGLRAVHDGAPGKLSLRAGAGHVRDAKQSFEAELEATVAADELLDRAPELAWLKPYMDGRSAWTVGVAIPKGSGARGATAASAISRLQLRSNLVGTALSLPAPMGKPAGAALATTVDAQLPLGEGEIAVAFGDRLALRTRKTNGQTGVRVVLGANRVDEAPPASGLIATGRTPVLDAVDWIALMQGGASGGGLPLRRIDVAADRLHLLGGVFADTRVRVAPADAGNGVQVDGPALAGGLVIPSADGASIAGRFQRLHWRSATAGAKATAAPAAVVDDGLDPSKVPPLNFVVDDVRVGDAELGSATVRTRPTSNGLQVTQLSMRAPKQRIDATGDWSGRGAAARTQVVATVASGDFGALLAGSGAGGRLAGGEGTARFEAGWPGSPAGFSLGGLEGNLRLDVKDGRLVEVEPGAGRVLGLLSVAALPRRLLLDFRDFFAKGFAFNRLEGSVRFAGGQARSDDLAIEGPAAEINIRGAANLRAQTFDQTIEVLPRTGNLLTAVGAIAGGPVGAAVGAVANAVLKKPLGQLNAKTYRVTGPWKDPKVEVMAKTPPSARADPPSGQGSAQ